MAGLLPSRTRVYDNAAEFAADIPTYAHHLRRLGYVRCCPARCISAAPTRCTASRARLTTDIYPADFGWTPDWDHPQERPSWYHNMSSVTQAGLCVRKSTDDNEVEVEIAPNVRVRLARSGIAEVRTKGEPVKDAPGEAAPAKSLPAKKDAKTPPIPEPSPGAMPPAARKV